jgi:hypothetical protein
LALFPKALGLNTFQSLLRNRPTEGCDVLHSHRRLDLGPLQWKQRKLKCRSQKLTWSWQVPASHFFLIPDAQVGEDEDEMQVDHKLKVKKTIKKKKGTSKGKKF